MQAYINSLGLCTEGIASWTEANEVLSGKVEYRPEPVERYKPRLLPPNERRRATNLIRLAFKVSEESTIYMSENELAQLSSTFTSSDGDHSVIDQINTALTKTERLVSPTQFHNSVHNAAAGYWGIASKSTAQSNSICASEYSFSVGLIEAMVLIQLHNSPSLLTSYDCPPSPPLQEKRDIKIPFALSLVLTPARTPRTLGKLTVTLEKHVNETKCNNPNLEKIRIQNPSARALPLLEYIAKKTNGDVFLPINPHTIAHIKFEK